MKSPNNQIDRKRKVSQAALLALAVLLWMGWGLNLEILSARAECRERPCQPSFDPNVTATPDADKLCGRLVFLHGYYPDTYGQPGVDTIGLIPCGRSTPLIFGTHPKHLAAYYRFRDPTYGTGKRICTAEYGCLERYLKSFQNYISLENCGECAVKGLPATWTAAPLTPYTPTRPQASWTPWATQTKPAATATVGGEQPTLTPDLFERLYGSETPAASATSAVSVGEATQQATARLAATSAPTDLPYYKRVPGEWLLALAVGGLIVVIVAVLREIFQD